MLIEGADLHVGTKAAGLREDLHASLGILAKDATFLRHQQELERLFERELVGWDVVGNRGCGDIAGLGFIVLDDTLLDVRAVAADTDDDGLAVFGHTQRNRVDGAGVDVGKARRHLLLKTRFAALLTKVKFCKPRHGLFGAACDLVEVVLHPSGEGVVDEVGEVAFHHIDHGERCERGHERRALLPHIAAVLDGANDRRVGRWAANAQFLKTLHEAGLGEPARRGGHVTICFKRDVAGGVTLLEGRKATLVVSLILVYVRVGVFFVNLTKAAMGDHCAGGIENNIGTGLRVGAESQLNGVTSAVRHLRGNGALPDQLIGTSLRLRNLLRHLIRKLKRVARRANGLVCLLRVLDLVGVVARSLGQVVGAVTLADHRARRADGGIRHGGAVGSHIGDEALFVQPLCRAHRHGRTHAELAAGFLLEG